MNDPDTTDIDLSDVSSVANILENNKFNDDSDRNKMAERVLLRLKQKLSGSEGGSFLGIKGHVNYLIQEARNVENLCRLFPGWQPYI